MLLGLSSASLLQVALLRVAVEWSLWRHQRAVPTEYRRLFKYATGYGNRTRPLATLLACGAVGGNWRRALPLAVAIELAHKASVVRDDLVDGDDYRRKRRTVHSRFGPSLAIAISDVLLSDAFSIVESVDVSPQHGASYLSLFVETYKCMAAGQVKDILPLTVSTVNTDERLLVNMQKTGALVELAFRSGALVGGGCDTYVDVLARFGSSLGVAFQLLNDINNIIGAEVSQRREIGSDLRLGRVTILLAHAIAQADQPTRRRLLALFRRAERLSVPEVDEIYRILMETGSTSYAEKLALQSLGEARSSLKLLPASRYREILASISQEHRFRSVVF
jgi:geranylgeranyl pyrophosphate synthase